MTIYYLVYGDIESGLSIGNFRSHNEQLVDALAEGRLFQIREIPNENGKPNATAKILEIAEILGRVDIVQNTQATADSKMARVLEEFETGIVQAPELLKFKAEKHPTDRAIAEWIVAEKTKHAAIVSRAYDTGEAGSIEKYTEEVQSIVRMTLDILEGGEPENTTASVKEVRMVPYQDGLETVIYKCVLCGLHKSLTHNTVAPDRIGCPECMLVTMLKPDDPVWGGDSTNKE